MGSRSRRNRIEVQDELMDVDEDEYTIEHKLMVQYLLHERMTKKQDLVTIHKDLFKNRADLNEVLTIITNKINPLKLDIKQTKCDLTGETYFVLIHTTGESFFPRCCVFTKPQLEFLKQVLTGIVLSSEGAVGKIQAINTCKTLTKSEAGDILEKFVKEKILMEAAGHGLCLTPLAILEFEPFFRACFSDNLLVCDLCKQLVFIGKACDGCDQRFHLHCVDKWMKSKRSECPSCAQQWP
uniref:Non-structural maintenance of chromosomes element 1 homolog n=1 Tax=Cuerna arida TaxID=1464854 RepID=A0A1B6EMM5_9HEMI